MKRSMLLLLGTGILLSACTVNNYYECDKGPHPRAERAMPPQPRDWDKVPPAPRRPLPPKPPEAR